MWQKKNSPRIVVDKARVRLSLFLSLFFVYTGANFALPELTHFLTHTLTQNRSPASGTATSMWGMFCENSQPTPLERAQQVCMLRLTTPHNPKVVGSNPAPATTSRRTLVVRRIFLRKKRLHRSGCRSSPQKVSLRLHCSLASALTTFRLATNFLRIFPLFCNQEQAGLDALPVPLFPRLCRVTHI